MGNRLTRVKLTMYKAARAIDRDFMENGERPYFGLTTFMSYAEYMAVLAENRAGKNLPEGWSPYELNALINEDGDILCLGQLRFGDDCGNTTWAGHIGYTVPPSLRGNGYAKEYLNKSLERAWSLRFGRVLLTCDYDNIASRKVIERCGGLYAGKFESGQYKKLQYWFYPR